MRDQKPRFFTGASDSLLFSSPITEAFGTGEIIGVISTGAGSAGLTDARPNSFLKKPG